MRHAGAAALAGLAGLAAVALGGCGDSTGSGDTVLAGSGSGSLDGQAVEVMLPSGQFTFTVAEPRDELTADETSDGESREAPDGQHYLGLEWAWEGMAGPAFALMNRDEAPQVATVSVDAGGDPIPVFELDPQDGHPGDRSWVLVPDDADPAIEVTYDGQTQRVDAGSGTVEAGTAEGLYDLAGLDADCPDQGPGAEADGLQYRIECTVGGAFAVPYVAGLGWAEEGRTWLLVQLELTASELGFTAGSESAGYRVADQHGSIAVEGGGDPQELWQADAAADGFGATYAVPVPADGPWPLEITHTFDLTRDGTAPGAPATEKVRYHSTPTIGS